MSDKRELYIVPKTLNAQARIFALPLDEFIPGLGLAALFFVFGQMLTCVIAPVLVVILIKLMKRGQGSSWLVNVAHWYLPRMAIHPVLRKTPPTEHREYIA